MISQSYSLTDTRQIVVTADNQNKTIYVGIVGNNTAYLGGSDVTDANGLPTKKYESFHEIFVPIGQTLYAVMASGETETLRILLPDGD